MTRIREEEVSLKQLHWLPVKQRVQYKLCMIMYSIHFGLAPLYITELVSTVAAQTSRPGLRSADTTNYVQTIRAYDLDLRPWRSPRLSVIRVLVLCQSTKFKLW